MQHVSATHVLAGVLLCVGAGCPTVAFGDAMSVAGRKFDCLMEARVTIKLGAAVTGLVAKVLVDRGDIVKEGQIVAQMESEVQSAIVAVAKIRASNDIQQRSLAKRSEFLNRKVDRLQSLRKTEAASQVALDEAQTDAFVAEHGVKEAELNCSL